MSTKTRLEKLEKKLGRAEDEIVVTMIGDDPDDPNFLIIDPFGPNPRRISRAEHEAENRRLEEAGETVIIVDYEESNSANYGK